MAQRYKTNNSGNITDRCCVCTCFNHFHYCVKCIGLKWYRASCPMIDCIIHTYEDLMFLFIFIKRNLVIYSRWKVNTFQYLITMGVLFFFHWTAHWHHTSGFNSFYSRLTWHVWKNVTHQVLRCKPRSSRALPPPCAFQRGKNILQ